MSGGLARRFGVTAGVVLLWAIASAAGAGQQEWRPLAVASFDEAWQVINDTYYDPNFGGLDWAAVRAELRPQIEKAQTPEDGRRIVREMIGRLRQSHFALLTTAADPETASGDALVPIDVRVIAAGVVITRVDDAPGARGSLHVGDRLMRIDGHATADWSAQATGADDRARRLDVWKHVYRALHGAAGSVAHLEIRDPADRSAAVEIRRVRESGESVTLGNLPAFHVRTSVIALETPRGRRVGAIGFNVWMTAVAAPFAAGVDAFRGADGIVVDLRGNPGGLADMIRGVAGHFLDEPLVLGRMQMRGAALEFRANPRRSTADGRRVEPFAGPVAVLVDELTASASECFTGGLQNLGRVRVFGVETMGQALPAATAQLADGDVLIHAVGDFVTSTGRRLEGPGVMPDEVVPLTVEGLAGGRDRVMDAALAWFDARVP